MIIYFAIMIPILIVTFGLVIYERWLTRKLIRLLMKELDDLS